MALPRKEPESIDTSNDNNGNNSNTNEDNTAILDNNDSNTPSNNTNPPPLQLRKNLGLIPGVSYVAGGIIGVGIFVSPQTVLLNAGQSVGVALCVWAFCAVIAFCGGLCYAEISSRISKSGGTYTYIREGFGDGLGFLFLWTQLMVVRPMSIALGALAASEYALRPLFLHCPQLIPSTAKMMIALCILGILVFLNSYSAKCGALFQTVSTVCKLAALFVVIVLGIISLVKGEVTKDLQEPFSPKGLSVRGITLAVYSCSYAYMGWDSLTAASEEVKNPQRNVPLATLFAVLLTTVVYILANVSYSAVLTTPQIVSGVAVVALFTDMTVPALMWFIVPCIAMSAIGSVNGNLFCSTRINFIGGRDGLFPEVLSMVSVSRKTPLVSCLLLGVVATVVITMAEDVGSVLGAYTFFRASGETVAILGMYRLRRKHPPSSHTYVAPVIVPVVYLVVNIILAVVAITRDTSRYVVPLGLTLTGIPVYFLSKSRMFRQGPLKTLNGFFLTMSHKLLLCDFASKEY